ncbi:hypothetical protein [Polynucleobacter kasalickyi]|uniref:Uncharacterized protein n=1 Tax=Polynucleobacter kasalickyi TaxID=1938817 RepID=A0A1W2AKK3_9BURK|nr:hypothetical protein [Polynucleobacter kasalickyi]SMC61032.1 hypothetical protein SAMN06296008_10924 [Polynucleobacter kasalickyi]
MKMIADTLGIPRSHLSQGMKGTHKAHSNYQETSDTEVLRQSAL